MRLEYGKQRNKPVGGGKGVPDVSGGQKHGDLAGRKG